jgi:hypothetical protein
MREPRQYEAPLCAQVDGDLWFPEKQKGNPRGLRLAKELCSICIHRLECAEWGITYERHGIWGGLTAAERKKIRGKRKLKIPIEKREDCA